MRKLLLGKPTQAPVPTEILREHLSDRHDPDGSALQSISPRSILYNRSLRAQFSIMASNNQNQAGAIGRAESAHAVALDMMYRQHREWLLRKVRSRFGRDQAEDLVQETYTRVASYVDCSVTNPRALLMQIATRAAIDRARRAHIRRAETLDLDEGRVEADQLDVVALRQVVLSLPDKVRRVFLLSRVAGLSNEEIAEHCAISRKTVEWRMTKALKMCAAKLGRKARS